MKTLKKITIVLSFAALCFVSSCGSDNGLTNGAVSLLMSYGKLFMKIDTCSTVHNGKIYAVSGVMAAADYNTPNGADTLVSYAVGLNTQSPNAIRDEWDCTAGAYTYYGFCPPGTFHFPYPCDAGHTNASYLEKFVEVDSFKKIKPADTVTSRNTRLPWIDLTTVQSLKDYHLEGDTGYINKNYSAKYADKKFELGIICILKLKSGETKNCYVIGNYDGTVQWKK